jgi:hypothetical protein
MKIIIFMLLTSSCIRTSVYYKELKRMTVKKHKIDKKFYLVINEKKDELGKK